jgi:hypothetical protein
MAGDGSGLRNSVCFLSVWIWQYVNETFLSMMPSARFGCCRPVGEGETNDVLNFIVTGAGSLNSGVEPQVGSILYKFSVSSSREVTIQN